MTWPVRAEDLLTRLKLEAHADFERLGHVTWYDYLPAVAQWLEHVNVSGLWFVQCARCNAYAIVEPRVFERAPKRGAALSLRCGG